ncbi:WAT1-related protein At5g64700-like isoform X2 [Olea europaea var. sylvestris]|uniref:WAT1-related protein At5g64700-like isoform X2 n=1 Tax=Olea europaea var. sylvestris TaxID=158386 RepID=UPI000C1D1C9F|nr:WAT1-related protein At5g64700-like isoform X2 [Olea europaea var. sylvestris]
MEMNKPFLVVLFIQSIYAGYFLLSKVAFDVGLNPYVFVFYRQAAATVFLAPTALFFQWKTAPPLSFTIFIKIFLLSLCGITMSLDIFGVALTYTTASLAAATINTLPVITFFLAILFRMEKVKLRTSPGFMKVSGVALCLAGATTIALYRGPFLKLLLHHHLIKSHHQQLEGHSIPSTLTWIKGVSLMLLSNLSWALWLVLQGIVVTGITFYLQTWVVEKKGPVYLAMTTPLILIFTTAASTFLFGEIISLGSVLGTLFLVGGLYCVLWGKTKEEEREKGICAAIIDAEKANGGIKEEITT